MDLCYPLLAIYCCFSIFHSETIVIDTQLGKIKGNVIKPKSTEFQTVYTFWGIRYAVPPVGNLRFRPAILNTSKWNGVYNGTNYGPICMQGGAQTQSEDCLFLNIWTPKPNNTGTLLPVMFWIHGGGFKGGSGNGYDGTNLLSQQKDFVYVTINYRLNALGFLSNLQLYNEDSNWPSYGGLNGVNDQITALKWVKQFISDYGGNPNQVTIFGESAGGQSVCFLTISPPAKGLFNRAISESGGCGGPWGSGPTSFGIEFCDTSLKNNKLPNNITYLRSLEAKDLLVIDIISAVDGVVLTAEPITIYQNLDKYPGILNVEKFIIGFNTLDGIIAYPYHAGAAPRSEAEYKEFLEFYIPNKEKADKVYSYYYPTSDFPFYPPNHNSYDLAWFSINADTCLSCPSLFMANQINKYISSDIVYIYQFGGPGKNGSFYAPHGSEIAFVFDTGNVAWADMLWDQELSNQLMSAWANFGKYGMPNITDSFDNMDFEWPLYSDGNNTNVIIFEDTLRINSSFYANWRQNVCEFWYYEIDYDVLLSICLDKFDPRNNSRNIV